jgi:hypothetical protein
MCLTATISAQTAEGDGGLYELTLEDAGSMFMSDVQRTFEECESETEGKWSSDVRTAEIEFWRSVGLGDSSTVYTAQSVNSTLFEKSVRLWNFNDMRRQSSQQKQNGKTGNRGGGTKVSAQGVLGLGMGMAGTARGWSSADEGCYTIQYLHTGAPRTVYAVSPEHRKRFEQLVAMLRRQISDEGTEASTGEEPDKSLSQGSMLIDPAVLMKHRIGLFKTTQRAGEFVVHWPSSFYSAFSHGVNTFEAVAWNPTPVGSSVPGSLAAITGDDGKTLAASASKACVREVVKVEPPENARHSSSDLGGGGERDFSSADARNMGAPRADAREAAGSSIGSMNGETLVDFKCSANGTAPAPPGTPRPDVSKMVEGARGAAAGPALPLHRGDGAVEHEAPHERDGEEEDQGLKNGETRKRRRSVGEDEIDARGAPAAFRSASGNGGLAGLHAAGFDMHPGMGFNKMTPWADGAAMGGMGAMAIRGAPMGPGNMLPMQHMALLQQMAAMGHIAPHPALHWHGQPGLGPAMLMAMHANGMAAAGTGRQGHGSGDGAQHDGADKNKNCHYCEHAPKRCAIFACCDPVCDQMFCENCCKKHLGRPTGFKQQHDAVVADWRCPICTKQCCCTQHLCDKEHLHCKRYRRKMKHTARKGIPADLARREACLLEEVAAAGGGLVVRAEMRADQAEQRRSLVQIKHGLDGAYRSDDDGEASTWAQEHQLPQLMPPRHRSREDSVGRLINGEGGPEDDDDVRWRIARHGDRRATLNAPASGSSAQGSSGGHVGKLLSPSLGNQSDAEMTRLMGAHVAPPQHLRRGDSATHLPLHININVSQVHSALGQSGTPNRCARLPAAARPRRRCSCARLPARVPYLASTAARPTCRLVRGVGGCGCKRAGGADARLLR